MQYNIVETDIDEERRLLHFDPACEKSINDESIMKARPARRFVRTAMRFGASAYISSICNEDWTQSMKDFATLIAGRITPHPE